MSFTEKYKPLLLIALLLIAACSSAPPPPAPAPNISTKVQNLELFLSRSNLNETEFEQFKIFNGKLFKECGQIRRGRFVPQDQSVEPLLAAQIQVLQNSIDPLATLAPEKFEPLGKNSGFFGPGQLIFKTQFPDRELSIKTSVDSISEAESKDEIKLRQLVQTLRHVAGGENALCGNKDFYGLNSDSK